MTRVIKRDNNPKQFIVAFDDGKVYTALVERSGNRLEAVHAYSCNRRVKDYTLDRHAKLLGRLSDAINNA